MKHNNLSAIQTEQDLTCKEARKKTMVERLKAAAKEEAQEACEVGGGFGRTWAEQDATPQQLQRLEDYLGEYDQGDVCWWDPNPDRWLAPFSATDHFAFALNPARDGDRDYPDEFWESALGEDAKGKIRDANFFRGFAEAASKPGVKSRMSCNQSPNPW
jgi:hypothetical protein